MLGQWVSVLRFFVKCSSNRVSRQDLNYSDSLDYISIFRYGSIYFHNNFDFLDKFVFRCFAVALIGSFGNLLTLLSIPWAIAHKKAIMHFVPMKYTNIFIVNLAWADFLYCVTSLPTYGYMVFIPLYLQDGEYLTFSSFSVHQQKGRSSLRWQMCVVRQPPLHQHLRILHVHCLGGGQQVPWSVLSGGGKPCVQAHLGVHPWYLGLCHRAGGAECQWVVRNIRLWLWSRE